MAIPTYIPPAGPLPANPLDLRAELVRIATELSPGLTADLPALMIEDVASTGASGLLLIDQLRVDILNSISPRTANDFILNLLGNQFGTNPQAKRPASVEVIVTGTPNWVVPPNFILSDGTHQYKSSAPGLIKSGGVSDPITFYSTTPGSFAIPANTVITPITPLDTGITATFTNPANGVPGTEEMQDLASYRRQVNSNMQASAFGLSETIRANVLKVPDVVERLVAVRQVSGGIMVLIGGGSIDDIKLALYKSVLPNVLQLSADTGRNVTASLIRGPDTYEFKFVRPLSQELEVTATWNTATPNLVAADAVTQAIQIATINYVNALPVGNLLNEDDLREEIYKQLGNVAQLDRLIFTYKIDGVTTALTTGKLTLPSSPEGYFVTNASLITVIRG